MFRQSAKSSFSSIILSSLSNIFLLSLFSLSSVVDQANGQATLSVRPGVKTTISQRGLDYAAELLVDTLAAEVSRTRIPDQKGRADVSVGNVEYDVTNIQIRNFVKPAPGVHPNPGAGETTVSVTNAGISLSGNWWYKFKKWFVDVRDSGSFDASASDASISMGIGLGLDGNGKATITTNSCSASVSSIDFRFHGGASWLYNLFTRFVKDKIRRELEYILCREARQAINVNTANTLASFRPEIRIDNKLMLNYRLVSSPEVGSAFLGFSHAGTFSLADTNQDAVSMTVPVDKMLGFAVSEVVVNNAVKVLHEGNFIDYQYDLTVDDAPSWVDREFIEEYRDASIHLRVKSSSPPVLRITQTGTTFSLQVLTDISTSSSGASQRTDLLRFTTKITSRVNLAIKKDDDSNGGDNLAARVENFALEIERLDYAVPCLADIDLALVNAAMRELVQQATDALKGRLEIGAPLPRVHHADFTNARLETKEGYLTVGFDVAYRA